MRTRSLRKIILLCSFGPFGSFIQAQSLCDSIYVGNIQYNAVDDQLIEVTAWTNGATGVDYPSFLLFNSTGDTLAVETVDLFVLSPSPGQIHRMIVRPTAQIPNGAFDGRLELYSGFDPGTLVCSWDLQDIRLCPSEPCTEAVIYLFNGSNPFPFTAYWWIADETGTWTEDGYFEVDTLLSAYVDTVCLAPGNYSLNFSPFSPIVPGYEIGISGNFPQSIGTNTTLQNDSTPLDLLFNWYEACIDPSNSILEHQTAEVELLMSNDQLQLTSTNNDRMTGIQLFGSDGRMVRSLNVRTINASIHVGDLISGIYLVHISTERNLSVTERIFIP